MSQQVDSPETPSTPVRSSSGVIEASPDRSVFIAVDQHGKLKAVIGDVLPQFGRIVMPWEHQIIDWLREGLTVSHISMAEYESRFFKQAAAMTPSTERPTTAAGLGENKS